jgi:hypothetical protein
MGRALGVELAAQDGHDLAAEQLELLEDVVSGVF